MIAPTRHADELARGWVARVNELMEATNCPILVALHLLFWFLIIWLLLWPGGGVPKKAGPLSGFLHWEGIIISMWRVISDHIRTKVHINDRKNNPRKVDRVSGAEEDDGKAGSGQRKNLK